MSWSWSFVSSWLLVVFKRRYCDLKGSHGGWKECRLLEQSGKVEGLACCLLIFNSVIRI